MRIIIEFDARELSAQEQPEIKVKSQGETGSTGSTEMSLSATDAGPAPGTQDETHSELPGDPNEAGRSASDATSAGGAPDLTGL